MSLKTFKSYTKSSRGTVLIDKKTYGKENPINNLLLVNILQEEEII